MRDFKVTATYATHDFQYVVQAWTLGDATAIARDMLPNASTITVERS